MRKRQLVLLAIVLTTVAASRQAECFMCDDWQVPGGWRHQDTQIFCQDSQGERHAGLAYYSCYVHDDYGIEAAPGGRYQATPGDLLTVSQMSDDINQRRKREGIFA